MSLLSPFQWRTIHSSLRRSGISSLRRGLATHAPEQFRVIEKCPPPTCDCRPMPHGLEIDYKANLNGTMAGYAEQVLISTGKDDWPSRIEEDEDAEFARKLKKLLGRGGTFSNPYHNVLISNSSFIPHHQPESRTAEAFLFPSFRYVPAIVQSHTSIEHFVQAFILPEELHKAHEVLSPEERARLRRKPELQERFNVKDVHEIVVLVCGHGGRDHQCGVLGPVLRDEFASNLQRVGFEIEKPAPKRKEFDPETYSPPPARVGLISHIGGHKYAGNVIVYIPPSTVTPDGPHPLAGKGIWYGRVEPGHVDGIVKETILNGNVIKELFRGGVGKGGEILRL